MNAASDIPNDLDGCKAFIHAQASELAERDKKIKELSTEMDKLRRLLNQLVNGSRSQRRIHDDPKQAWLPFESEEELQAVQRPRLRPSRPSKSTPSSGTNGIKNAVTNLSPNTCRGWRRSSRHLMR
jgi:hypothetical protein